MPSGKSKAVALVEDQMSWDTQSMERTKSLYVTEFAGGKEAAIKALSLSSDPQMQKFLRALTLKKNQRKSIYRIAADNHVTVSQMVQVMRDGYYSGILNLMFQNGEKTAKATLQDALPSWAACPRCDGRKTVLFPQVLSAPDLDGNRSVLEGERVDTCPTCQGEGRVRQSGSSKAQEMVFRATKVLEEKGITINNNQQNNFTGVDSMIDDLDARSPRQRVIEAQIDESE